MREVTVTQRPQMNGVKEVKEEERGGAVVAMRWSSAGGEGCH